MNVSSPEALPEHGAPAAWVAASERPNRSAASMLGLVLSTQASTRQSSSTASTSGTSTPPSRASPSQRSPSASAAKNPVRRVRAGLDHRRAAVGQAQPGGGADVAARDRGGRRDRGAEQRLGALGDRCPSGPSQPPARWTRSSAGSRRGRDHEGVGGALDHREHGSEAVVAAVVGVGHVAVAAVGAGVEVAEHPQPVGVAGRRACPRGRRGCRRPSPAPGRTCRTSAASKVLARCRLAS